MSIIHPPIMSHHSIHSMAFIEYATLEEADKAISAENGKELGPNTRPMTVRLALDDVSFEEEKTALHQQVIKEAEQA